MKIIKSLLLVILAAITFTACSPHPTYNKTDIPVEVVKLKEVKVFDTMLVINTKTQMFVFDNETNDYKTTIDKTKNENAAMVYGLFVGLVFGIIAGVLFAIIAITRK